MDNAGLLVNLVFALAAALLGALLAVRLGQSIIFGYILAGIAIGPFTPGFVADPNAVEALADIGIIFLLFAIGVQISLAELRHAGVIAIAGGSIQVLGMIGLGYLVGTGLGWGPLEALFFGAVISQSSGAVLSKVLSERGELEAEHGRISLAWSTIQELSTIVLVVVLSAMASGGQSVLTDVLGALAKAVVFFALLMVVGSRLLPWFFERVAALRGRELFLLTVAITALGTAYVSTFFGLSLALGAFAAGVVVSESDLSHQILGDVLPLRDLLAGIFFVSVGMLVDPLFVLQNALLVLLVLCLIVVAKGLLSALIIWAARYPVKTAVLTGLALGQSAEFSFLLARLGTGLGVVTPAAFNLMLAGAAASIILAPSLAKAAPPLARWLDRRLPESPLAREPAESGPPLSRHAVICGCGRVGQVIAGALQRRGFSFIVIEQDPRLVRRLRARGLPALLGNADNPVLLDRAGVAEARAVIVAIPDPLAARQIVDYAKRLNPRLHVVVRTHSLTELRFLQDRGVGEAVLGEFELALEMTRHTLRRFGVPSTETLAILQGLRARTPFGHDDAWLDPPD